MASRKGKMQTTNTTKKKTKSSKKSFAAAHAVINTPELLENILLQLPTKRLLLSQRVNKQFKGTIDGSTKLQQALFFQLATEDGTGFGDDGVNPLLDGKTFAFPGRFKELRVGYGFMEGRRHTDDITDEYMIDLSFDNLSKKPKDKGESWRKMYMMQSPRKPTMILYHVRERGYFHLSEEVEPEGIQTIGEVFDAAWKDADKSGAFDDEARLDDLAEGEEFDEDEDEDEDESDESDDRSDEDDDDD